VNPWDKSARSTSKRSTERPWPKLLTRPTVPMPVAGQERAAAPLATGSEWTVPILEKFDAALVRHAQRNGLVTFPVQYEVITADDLEGAMALARAWPLVSRGGRIEVRELTTEKFRPPAATA